MAAPYDLTIRQGYAFDVTWTWCNPIVGSNPPRPDPENPINLVGYAARMEIRNEPGDADPPILSLSDAPGGGIVLGGVAGTIAIFIPALVTAEFDFSIAYYEVKMLPAADENQAIRLVRASMFLEPRIAA